MYSHRQFRGDDVRMHTFATIDSEYKMTTLSLELVMLPTQNPRIL